MKKQGKMFPSILNALKPDTRTARFLYSAAAALLTVAFIATGVFTRLDRWVQDGLFQRGGVPNTDIVIIGIDEYALDVLGPYPTNYRDYVAYALEEMAADSDKLPAAVLIDVIYEGNTNPSADAHLAAAAQKLGCTVTASMAEYGTSPGKTDGQHPFAPVS